MQFWTTYEPDQVLQMAAQALAAERYAVSHGPGIVTGSRKGKPSTGLGCLLMCLLIVPGVIYFMVGGKQETASLTAVAQDGFTLVATSGAMWGTLRQGIEYHAA